MVYGIGCRNVADCIDLCAYSTDAIDTLLMLGALLMVIVSAAVIGWVRNPVWVVRFEEDVAWVQNVHPSILDRDSIPVWEEQDWSW